MLTLRHFDHVTYSSSELAPNMFGASSELASVMEFGFKRFAVNTVTCIGLAITIAFYFQPRVLSLHIYRS